MSYNSPPHPLFRGRDVLSLTIHLEKHSRAITQDSAIGRCQRLASESLLGRSEERRLRSDSCSANAEGEKRATAW